MTFFGALSHSATLESLRFVPELNGCEPNKPCIKELPGLQCADGTNAFYSVTLREGADSLVVYLDEGGACWNSETCSIPFFIKNSSRPKHMRDDWTSGGGIWNSQDSENPFAKRYNVVSIPYCTGDAFIGNRVTQYDYKGKPYSLRHVGYNNVSLVLEAAKMLFPNPYRLVLIGGSAGGIGAAFHMRNLAKWFPKTKKYVINDGGTPFLPAYLKGDELHKAMVAWGADTNFPTDIDQPARHFGDLWAYNRAKFPEIRYAFIHSYGDPIMMFFATALGAITPGNVIRDTLVDAAINYIGEKSKSHKVFYIDNVQHTRLFRQLEYQNSDGKNLRTWLNEMVNDLPWQGIRPISALRDLTR